MIHLLNYNDFVFINEDDGISPKQKKLHIEIDKKTGEKVIDKTKVPPEAQIRVLAKKLYQATIDMGRAQSIMMDKVQALQAQGADENMVGQIQQSAQDEMQAKQMAQMDIEMYMMNVGGANQQLSMLAQRLSGEAKMLADKANKEWFDKRSKKMEADIVNQLKQKQIEAQKKQEEEEKAKQEKAKNGDEVKNKDDQKEKK